MGFMLFLEIHGPLPLTIGICIIVISVSFSL